MFDGAGSDDEDHDGIDDGSDSRFNASLRDAVILLIDVAAPMWQALRVHSGSNGDRAHDDNDDNLDSQSNEDEEDGREVPIVSVLRLGAELLANKIIASENDLVGVVLYGSRGRNNSNDFECVWVAQELDVPDAHRIQELNVWSEQPQQLRERIGGGVLGPAEEETEHHPLGDALWTCSTMFASCRVKVGTRAIFLFTNEDNPHALAPSLNSRVLQRCRDLNDLQIDVEFFPLLSQSMQARGSGFRHGLFWRNVLPYDEEEQASGSVDVCNRFDELRQTVRRKIFKKRSLARLPMLLPGGIELAVRMYNLVQETKKSAAVRLQASNHQLVKATTKWICETTGQLLMPSQLRYGFPIGDPSAGNMIEFSKEELEQIKFIDRPGVYLMGFKPRQRIKPYYQVRHSAFLYPDEAAVRGSTVLFGALLTQMWEMDRVAIARFTPRTNAEPRFVALVPQLEAVDEQRRQVRPPGFNVIFLPFFEDMRSLDFEQQPRATREQITAAKVIAKKLRIAFDPDDFENPALQKHYASLQALAVDKDSIDVGPDTLEPDNEFIGGLQPIIDQFIDSVPDLVHSLQRGAAEADATGRAKRSRPATDPDELDWPRMSVEDIGRQTVATLKSYCQANGLKLPTKALKADVLKIVIDHLLPTSPAADSAIASSSSRGTSFSSVSPSSSFSSQSSPSPSMSLTLSAAPSLGSEVPSAEVLTPSSQGDSQGSQSEGRATKRHRSQPQKTDCMYGRDCRRHNPDHFQQFQHPFFTDDEISQRISSFRK